MATSRTDRDLARGRRAAAYVRIRGGSALATACARVGATFSPAIRHSIFKDRVATLIRRGAAHPEVRIRYGMFVERHRPPNLDAAIVLIDRMRCAELGARADAVGNSGYCGRSRLSLMLLDEVRLILRMLRRHAPGRFPQLTAEIRGRRSRDGR
jgi:hypothetical protein